MSRRIKHLAHSVLQAVGLTTANALRREHQRAEAAVEHAHSRRQRNQAQEAETRLRLDEERRKTAALQEELRSEREQRAEAVRQRDDARAQLQTSRARLDAKHAKLAEARTSFTRLVSELDSPGAALERIRSINATARDHLGHTLAARVTIGGLAPDPLAVGLERALVERSLDYGLAQRNWERGERPPGARELMVSGLRITVPPDGHGEGSLSDRLARGWLPLVDIARVRQFVVGGVMLDVGANIGTTSIPRLVLGDFARVYAAEPDALNFQCLVGNCLDNGVRGRVLPERLAIGDVNGTSRLALGTHVGSHHLLAGDRHRDEPFAEVTCSTLDAWIDRLAVPLEHIAFVKVDTQGWDTRVLTGAPALLRCGRAVWQVEVSPQMMKRAGNTMADLALLIQEHFDRALDLDPTSPGPIEAADIGPWLEGLQTRRSFTNLLLFNRHR